MSTNRALYFYRNPYDINNFMEKLFKKTGQRFKRYFFIRHTHDFFRGSLHCTFDVTEEHVSSLNDYQAEQINGDFDCIIFNHECVDPAISTETLEQYPVLNDCRLPKILFIGSDFSGFMLEDEVLDWFDLVFKREPFIDLGRYDLSTKNRDKIRPTILNCPLLDTTLIGLGKVNPSGVGCSTPAQNTEYDVAFLGRLANMHRKQVLELVDRAGFQLGGGLYDSENIPPALEAKKLSQSDYREMIRHTAVNLALEGAGQFTHRHLEIWCLCGFMMSSPSLRKLWLPFDVEEDVHYVTFDSGDECLDKISYYLEHETERHEIAKNGRELFEREYRFDRHGNYIRAEIEGLD